MQINSDFNKMIDSCGEKISDDELSFLLGYAQGLVGGVAKSDSMNYIAAKRFIKIFDSAYQHNKTTDTNSVDNEQEETKYNINVVGTQMSSDIKVGDVLIEGSEDIVKSGKGHFITVSNVYSSDDKRTEVEYYEDNWYHSTKTYYCHFKVYSQPFNDIINVYRIVGTGDSSLHTELNDFDIIGYCDYLDVKPGDKVLTSDIKDRKFQTVERVNTQVLGSPRYEWTIPDTNDFGSYYIPCIHCLFKLVSEEDGKYKVLKLVDNGKSRN